ncbi:MAG: cobyrinate a,c-diamide synthase, partial [Desulfobulbia bacterium]
CNICGVILNRVASERHEYLLRQAITPLGIPVLGVLRNHTELSLPSRHLGLVQAKENEDFETFANKAGRIVAKHIDLDKLVNLAQPIRDQLDTGSQPPSNVGLRPLGQVIAVAQDSAFDFSYPHILEKWRKDGAEIIPFSPLANKPPSPRADAVYLPGGYPELFAGLLSTNTTFLDGLRRSAENDCLIYGECGGYMVLGEFLTDKQGDKFPMARLLPVSTSFFTQRLHLGYRRLRHTSPLPWAQQLRGHEFHYACITELATDTPQVKFTPLFEAEDVEGHSLGNFGHCWGRTMGSFAHVIDQEHDDTTNRSENTSEPACLLRNHN